MELETNVLYYGDNLEILRKYIPNSSIDLIYLDPPFNSKASYNVLYKELTGELSQAQITAFEDTWQWGIESELALKEIVSSAIAPQPAKELISVLPNFVGKKTPMMAYITMMCIRLIELKRVLKDAGSIYLHCDPTASHYLKVLMDTIFGAKSFKSEIAWCYRAGGIPRKGYPSKHDILLFYIKTEGSDFTFNHEYIPYTEGTLQRGLTQVKGKYFEKGLRPEGTPIQDWWIDIQKVLSPTAKEMLGYPTQKPLSLLERIVKISSNEGDVVLDPFCGCGTTVVAAQKFNRKWIGIDITHLAISTMKWRLEQIFHITAGKDYQVIGEPKDVKGAEELASQNKYQFQWWAVSLIGGQPYGDKKKGADTVIDGYLYFMDEKDKVKKGIISVKSGHVTVSQIRDLIGVVKREKAEMGVFLTLITPTKPMQLEAVSEGFYHSPLGKDYQKIQILTITDIQEGKKPDIPPWISPLATPSSAKKAKGKTAKLF
jgi:site-specific DNA-methyltransferase (adenine-specific)